MRRFGQVVAVGLLALGAVGCAGTDPGLRVAQHPSARRGGWAQRSLRAPAPMAEPTHPRGPFTTAVQGTDHLGRYFPGLNSAAPTHPGAAAPAPSALAHQPMSRYADARPYAASAGLLGGDRDGARIAARQRGYDPGGPSGMPARSMARHDERDGPIPWLPVALNAQVHPVTTPRHHVVARAPGSNRPAPPAPIDRDRVEAEAQERLVAHEAARLRRDASEPPIPARPSPETELEPAESEESEPASSQPQPPALAEAFEPKPMIAREWSEPPVSWWDGASSSGPSEDWNPHADPPIDQAPAGIDDASDAHPRPTRDEYARPTRDEAARPGQPASSGIPLSLARPSAETEAEDPAEAVERPGHAIPTIVAEGGTVVPEPEWADPASTDHPSQTRHLVATSAVHPFNTLDEAPTPPTFEAPGASDDGPRFPHEVQDSGPAVEGISEPDPAAQPRRGPQDLLVRRPIGLPAELPPPSFPDSYADDRASPRPHAGIADTPALVFDPRQADPRRPERPRLLSRLRQRWQSWTAELGPIGEHRHACQRCQPQYHQHQHLHPSHHTRTHAHGPHGPGPHHAHDPEFIHGHSGGPPSVGCEPCNVSQRGDGLQRVALDRFHEPSQR